MTKVFRQMRKLTKTQLQSGKSHNHETKKFKGNSRTLSNIWLHQNFESSFPSPIPLKYAPDIYVKTEKRNWVAHKKRVLTCWTSESKRWLYSRNIWNDQKQVQKFSLRPHEVGNVRDTETTANEPTTWACKRLELKLVCIETMCWMELLYLASMTYKERRPHSKTW